MRIVAYGSRHLQHATGTVSEGSGIRLPSGPCLLNQATLDRLLWNQNLVVALWDAEMNEGP